MSAPFRTVEFRRKDGTTVRFAATRSTAFACAHCDGTGMVEYAEGPHEWWEPCRKCEAGRAKAEHFDYRRSYFERAAAYDATYRW